MIRKNILTILVSVAIFWLSMANSGNFDKVSPINFPNIDKIVHVGMYFALMCAILYENRKRLVNNHQLITAAVFALSYGIFIELLQSLTVSRSTSFYDALADAAGIIISIILLKIIRAAASTAK